MYKLVFKRIFDILAALFMIFVFFIPMIIISALIKIDSKGGVFYRQKRIGRGGAIFKIFKFRTMVANADQIGGYSTMKNDNRITKIGAFLRKTSLDEIPQIFNIFLGNMSLIGPRPDVPHQKSNYTEEEFIKRHNVLPGISGLAQSRNRHNLNNKNRKRYDIFYNEKISLFLDIKIIFWTIKTLLKGSY
ncbi:MAG: sugar transferase [Flavobacteriaceae bacterium]|nr:sugar transferase [Flavobacteriaceae bacterium]